MIRTPQLEKLFGFKKKKTVEEKCVSVKYIKSMLLPEPFCYTDEYKKILRQAATANRS